jgi:hypothetical protein
VTFNHYTANGNFNGSTYEPGAYGFNVADVGSNAEVAALPTGAMRCFLRPKTATWRFNRVSHSIR